MFELYFSKETISKLKELKADRGLEKRYKAIQLAFKKIQHNPRHPGLQTHEYHSLIGPNKEKIFESYAENNTPSAYRIFFFYGPVKRAITIVTILPHP